MSATDFSKTTIRDLEKRLAEAEIAISAHFTAAKKIEADLFRRRVGLVLARKEAVNALWDAIDTSGAHDEVEAYEIEAYRERLRHFGYDV